MSKKSRLGEDAAIYQQNNRQSEKEKLKEMSWSKRFSYFWDYYRYHALLFIVLVAFIYYAIYTFTRPKVETRLYAAIVNNTVDSQIWDEYANKMAEHLDLDTTSENVVLNYNFQYKGSPEYEVNSRQSFAIYLAASEMDLIIAPMSEFANYVDKGFFTPLSDQLPTDLYSSLADRFYLTGTEENPRVSAYGIYLADTKLYKEYSYFPGDDDPILIGIVANSLHKENAVEFIRYIFNEK